jgi:hypothetical protein
VDHLGRESGRIDSHPFLEPGLQSSREERLSELSSGRRREKASRRTEEVAVGTECAICGMAAEVVVTHEGRDDCPGVFGHASDREHVHHACENGHEWVGYPLAASV